MPELPDVAEFHARFDACALKKTVRRIRVFDERILPGTSPQGLGRRLKDQTFRESARHGKYLFARTEHGWLVMHFGMTGDLVCYGKNDEPPDHTVVRFDFRDGGRLAYVSQRKIGRIDWASDKNAFIRDESLGPDMLDDDLTSDGFLERLSDRRGMIKSALMDQSVVAGIGNIWADEILFQTGIHPKNKCSNIPPDDLREVYRVARRILRTGSRANIEGRPLPKSYLGPHRERGGECPACGGKLSHVSVHSRTGIFCPACQKE